MADDEDVIFENSPLEKYLKEIEYSEYEEIKRHQVKQENDLSKKDRLMTWIKSNGYQKKDLFQWLFGTTPSIDELEAARKEYIFVVAESGVVSEDDLDSLSHFLPELFNPREQNSKNGEKSGYFQTFPNRTQLASVFVVLIASLFATVTDLLYTSIVLLIVLLIAGLKFLVQLYFKRQHWKNLEALRSYTKLVKELALLLRKSIMLIQEMEIISRGYTFVGVNIPALFLEKDTDLTSPRVYPVLRQVILKNTEELISCSRGAARQLCDCLPLSHELNRMFTTYLSVEDICYGRIEESPGSSRDKLSLQGLKTLASTLVSLQSEFLSRFLLCLSVEANTDVLCKLHNKLFGRIDAIFSIPLDLTKASLTSIETSYHIHKSACFAKEKEEKPHAKMCDKWMAFDTALHSLELHLQAGILRIQSLQDLRSQLQQNETDEKNDNVEESETNKHLETTFQWLKIDLDAAMTCWENGESRLNDLLKRELSKQGDSKPLNMGQDLNVEESQSLGQIMELDDEVEDSDRVFEAFADPSDETYSDQPILTAEDLAQEKSKLQESRHLLHELKVVLSTKAKDPLISTAGFVEPVKPTCQDKTNTNTEFQEEISHSAPHQNNEFTINGTQYDERNSAKQTLFHDNVNAGGTEIDSLSVSDQFPDSRTNQQPAMFSNLQSSVALSVAMAAAMRTKAMGLGEESFICDDSD